jgi:NAD(P)-dependent dehydrogenase (short-subunit alcohol dehydrogenase family)
VGLLDNKVVLLSGGASGIGRATGLQVAGEGASVLVGDVDLAGAQSFAQEISEGGGKALAAHLDVRNEQSDSHWV